jgi:hypothetical protein
MFSSEEIKMPPIYRNKQYEKRTKGPKRTIPNYFSYIQEKATECFRHICQSNKKSFVLIIPKNKYIHFFVIRNA